jgi:uncharacterized protein (DUF1697 family)
VGLTLTITAYRLDIFRYFKDTNDMKYIALLRGINVGGNNKLSMAELKACFEALGYTQVTTYINSGNVIFEAPESSTAALVKQCEGAIESVFGFRVVCSVISTRDLEEAVRHAPDWWGLPDGDKHNAIFAIAPLTTEEIMAEVGEAKPEYEKVAAYGSVIFWTAPLKTFGRTRYSKIVSTTAYKSITIRNATTTRKLVALSK